MDYEKIILDGITDKNNSKYLKEYFIREYKKAEKENYSADEFFDGCISVVQNWIKNIQAQKQARKIELCRIIEIAKRDRDEKMLNRAKNDLKDEGLDEIGGIAFPVNLSHVTNGKAVGQLTYEHLALYRKCLTDAYNESTTKAISEFSVLEWATIFYYADEAKLLPTENSRTKRFDSFIQKYKIPTTKNNFKNTYYKAKKRINEFNNYPIEKLEHIKTFLKENYPLAVTPLSGDIDLLENYKVEN